MKYLGIIYFSSVILLFSCGTSAKDENETPSLDTTKNIVSTGQLNGCYSMNIGNDTAFLQLSAQAVFVKGSLAYKRFEKDSNKGTLEGTINGNIIKTWYKFSSEGVISVREIYFKINGNKLAEGYGEMDMKNDTAFFRYPATISYEEQHPYMKVNCSGNF